MFLEAGIEKPNMDANVDHTSLVQILDLPYESPKEQFMLLSSFSNFYKFGYPVMSELSSKSHIMYAECVLYDPFSKEDMEGNNIRKYIPVSPPMYHLLQYPLLKDQGMDEPNMEYKTPEIPRPRKKRKHSARLVSVTLHCHLVKSMYLIQH